MSEVIRIQYEYIDESLEEGDQFCQDDTFSDRRLTVDEALKLAGFHAERNGHVNVDINAIEQFTIPVNFNEENDALFLKEESNLWQKA